jgi:hypothetical protein
MCLLCLLALVSCGSSTEVLMECPSPSGKLVASFYRVMGGGAAGWQVFRVEVRKPKTQYGSDSAFEMQYAYSVRLEWSGDESLTIGYPSSAGSVKHEAQSSDVTIEAKPLPSQNGTFADPGIAGCFNL